MPYRPKRLFEFYNLKQNANSLLFPQYPISVANRNNSLPSPMAGGCLYSKKYLSKDAGFGFNQ